MPVTVRLFAAARAAAGTDSAHAGPGSLGEVTTALTDAYPDLATVLPRCSYLLDGVAVHGDPADVMVNDGSELDVLPPFAGG
jgi:molybdopterin converting factor small subunit